MAEEIKTTLEGNRTQMFNDITSNMPTAEEFGIEPVNVEDIMKAFNEQVNNNEQ